MRNFFKINIFSSEKKLSSRVSCPACAYKSRIKPCNLPEILTPYYTRNTQPPRRPSTLYTPSGVYVSPFANHRSATSTVISAKVFQILRGCEAPAHASLMDLYAQEFCRAEFCCHPEGCPGSPRRSLRMDSLYGLGISATVNTRAASKVICKPTFLCVTGSSVQPPE